jgi:hypothetical protein
MRVFACLLFCILSVGPFAAVRAQGLFMNNDQQPGSNVLLAAELARIASKLAVAVANNGALGHRHHRRPPAAVSPHTEEAAAHNVKKGLVQSVPVVFKGHNLTVVALSHE